MYHVNIFLTLEHNKPDEKNCQDNFAYFAWAVYRNFSCAGFLYPFNLLLCHED